MRRLFILCLSLMSVVLLNVNTTVLAQNKGPSTEQFRPKQVKIDTNHDGTVDRIESYDDKGVIVSLKIDTTGDGKMDEKIFYKNGGCLFFSFTVFFIIKYCQIWCYVFLWVSRVVKWGYYNKHF